MVDAASDLAELGVAGLGVDPLEMCPACANVAREPLQIGKPQPSVLRCCRERECWDLQLSQGTKPQVFFLSITPLLFTLCTIFCCR